MNGDEATIQIEREVVDGKPTSTLWVWNVSIAWTHSTSYDYIRNFLQHRVGS